MQSDISRILDPSYYSSSKHTTQPRVYYDRKGNMHDPDYRHFPIMPSSYATTSSLDSDEEEQYVDPFSQPRAYSRASPFPSSSPASSLFNSSLSHDAHKLKKSRRASLDSYQEEEEDESEEGYDSWDEEVDAQKTMKKPEMSCSEAMKRQLQTLSFSLGYGVFRARRRVRNALNRL
ncbi:hypothetical protein CPB85DRAFT_1294526 [Mucidula mucida]|nr:hypothetical protein CPB85DRAFT_1294526 [Mucidula mucida]